jgi:acyl carrier protein
MSTSDTAARIRELLSTVVEIEVESDDDDIFETGRLDSLGLVELIFAIEEQLGVALALDQLEVEEFRTVRSIVALVSSAQQPLAAAS